ncbi:hypothetical protein ACQCN2_15560 [Brevibacillus ginsengisoli]|uniref:hypothetical protein n=1 Tax=Brevibacillus ginsengisoli TaxID=363854 RepID=UPI003CF906AF
MKKLMSKLMVGAVALSVLAPSVSYAATISPTTTQAQQTQHHMKQMTPQDRQANQAKLMEVINKYTPELSGQFQAIFDKQEANRAKVEEILAQEKAGTLTKEQAKEQLKALGLNFGQRGDHDKDGKNVEGKKLDAATKAKVEAIRQQEKAGTLTKEQAQEQLKALGLNFGQHKDHDKDGKNVEGKKLDAATKAKVEAIRQQEKAGTLTKEQAKEQLKALGLNFGQRGDHDKDGKNVEGKKLDAATKAKVEAIRQQEKAGTLTKEQAKEQLKALGLNFGQRGDHDKDGKKVEGKKLDAATKAKVEAIRQQEKAGTLTKEQAKEQLKALGLNFGQHKEGQEHKHNSIVQQINDAAAKNDAATVKELLTKLLAQLQEHQK